MVGIGTNKSGAVLAGAQALPTPVRTALTQALKAVGASGAKNTLHRIPTVAGVSAKSVVLVGLGPVREVDHETLRRAAGAATRELAGLGKVVLGLPATTGEEVTAIAEGALFGAYSYNRYRSNGGGKTPVGAIVVSAPATANAAARAGIRRAKVLADAVHAPAT